MNTDTTLSIVLPVYREAEHIKHSLSVIRDAVVELEVPFEIICVDDGSPDATWQAIQEASQCIPEVRAIKFSRNFGKEGAVLAGLEASRGAAVIVMDCDLQHPPEIIPEMFRLWRTGEYKVIDGVKETTNRRSPLGELGARFFYSTFQRLTKADLSNSSDFKLLDREVVNAYLVLRERRLFFRGIVSWMGFSHAQVRFNVAQRTAGTSKFSPLKLMHMAMEALVSFSSVLLQGATLIGCLFFVFALAIGLHTSYLKVTGRAVEGFTTVILIELIVGSMVLLGLGVIGTYIARIHEELKARPRYLIEDELCQRQELRVQPMDRAA